MSPLTHLKVAYQVLSLHSLPIYGSKWWRALARAFIKGTTDYFASLNSKNNFSVMIYTCSEEISYYRLREKIHLHFL